MVIKTLTIIIVIIMFAYFISCQPIDEANLLRTKYNLTKTNAEEYNVPILSFKETDDILMSFLNEENRQVTFENESLIVKLGKESLNYNMIFTFAFDKECNTLFYLGCDKKIICDDFFCNVNGISLESNGLFQKCMVKGYMIFNVEGEGCSFPFILTVDTNLKDTFKTTFDFKI